MSEAENARLVVAYVMTDGSLVLNRGSEQGIMHGQRFLVYRQGPMITDPETGRNLGHLETIVGRGMITHVQEEISTLESTEYTKPFVSKANEIVGGLGGLGGFMRPREETVPPQRIPFRDPRVGDFLRRI